MKRNLLPLLLPLLLVLAMPALAAAQAAEQSKDYIFKCLPNFAISSQKRNFDKLEIKTKNPETNEITKTVYEGNLVFTIYAFKGDKDQFPSDLQMIRHYQNSVKKLDGKILYEEDRLLHASFTRNDKQYYMIVNPYGWNIDVKILEIQELADESQVLDVPAKAPTTPTDFMFKGMANFAISSQKRNFDKLEIKSRDAESNKVDKTTYEGNLVYTLYAYKGDTAQFPSDMQMIRHYKNSLKKVDGKILYEEDRLLHASFTRNGKQYYMIVNPYGWNIDVKILEIEEMADDSEIVDSDTILHKLDTEGFITLYINFDTGKSTIKPESMEIIDEIVTALKSKPALKVKLEGHTDNVGNAADNKKLSDDRANAVMSAIVAKGIDKGRLSAEGFGLERPIADNNTEAGRAKNRRVALVKVQADGAAGNVPPAVAAEPKADTAAAATGDLSLDALEKAVKEAGFDAADFRMSKGYSNNANQSIVSLEPKGGFDVFRKVDGRSTNVINVLEFATEKEAAEFVKHLLSGDAGLSLIAHRSGVFTVDISQSKAADLEAKLMGALKKAGWK